MMRNRKDKTGRESVTSGPSLLTQLQIKCNWGAILGIYMIWKVGSRIEGFGRL
jgi:hypothetical protein